MPNFLGKRISLISKAGIRYEGILYTIDPTESTVALSKVKSFGTEDRTAERFIPPRDEVYEYIIFRGSDIRDLHVCENSLYSEDSAIVKIMSPNFPNQSPIHVTMPHHGIDVVSPEVNLKNQDRSPSGFYSQPNQNDIRVPKNSALNENSLVREPSVLPDAKAHHAQKNQENTELKRQKSDSFDMDKIATNDFHQFMNREQHLKSDTYKNEDERDYTNYRRGSQRRGMRHQEIRRGSQYNSAGNGIPSSRAHKINKEIISEAIRDDFDFESSNALIAEELANLSVLNDDTRNKTTYESKESSDSKVTDYIEEKLYYDKTKSFFDNISSEMSERMTSERKNERRSNTETFGDPNSNRGSRGNRWGGRRGQFRGNYTRGSSAGFIRRGNGFNRGDSRGSNPNKRLISVGGNRGNVNEN